MEKMEVCLVWCLELGRLDLLKTSTGHDVLPAPIDVGMRVDFRLEGGDEGPSPVLVREGTSATFSPDLPAVAPSIRAARGKHLQRALWIFLGYGLAKVNLRRWASAFLQEAAAAEHKGLFVSVVTLILTLYVLCMLAPMNAVAEWDTRWRGGSGGRRSSGITHT